MTVGRVVVEEAEAAAVGPVPGRFAIVEDNLTDRPAGGGIRESEPSTGVRLEDHVPEANIGMGHATVFIRRAPRRL